MRRQAQRLENIGMDWCSNAERAWDQNYTVVKRYYTDHGNVNIPHSCKTADGTMPGLWIYLQKRNLCKYVLTTEQVLKLEQVGTTAN